MEYFGLPLNMTVGEAIDMAGIYGFVNQSTIDSFLTDQDISEDSEFSPILDEILNGTVREDFIMTKDYTVKAVVDQPRGKWQSSIADSFKQQLAAMQAQRQAELDAMQRSFAQQMAQADQEARRRARELQIAQQTQMANVARGSAEGQFKLGAQRDGKGVAAFKRRLQITPATAQGLSIATNAALSTNMLNV